MLKGQRKFIIFVFVVLSFFSLVFTISLFYLNDFGSLSSYRSYASNLDEFIKQDDENIENPTYEFYYKKRFNQRKVGLVTIKKLRDYFFSCCSIKFCFSLEDYFKSQLCCMAAKQLNIQRTDKFVHLEKIDFEKAKIVVFGRLQGAFHSLTRYLEKLNELNIIDEELKILNKNTYFIFLGGMFVRSAYGLETFSLVLELLKKNPKNVICIKGKSEDSKFWKAYSLGREIESRYPNNTEAIVSNIDRFFDLLPHMLCIYFKEKSNDKNFSYLKFYSAFTDEKISKLLNGFDINHYLSNLREIPKKLDLIEHRKGGNISPKFSLMAIVKDIYQRQEYEQMNGLRLMPPANGVTTWTVLSCPTESYRLGFKFYNDAFALIKYSTHYKQPIITLFKRDIRLSDSQFSTEKYLFKSGLRV